MNDEEILPPCTCSRKDTMTKVQTAAADENAIGNFGYIQGAP
jgi:hypothetical protein